MEKSNDKSLDIKEKIEEHKQGDQEMQDKKEIQSHENVANAQSSVAGSYSGIEKAKAKKKYVTLAYWIMIAVVIATCIFVVYSINSNAHQCLIDPLKYYSEKIGQQCTCFNWFP